MTVKEFEKIIAQEQVPVYFGYTDRESPMYYVGCFLHEPMYLNTEITEELIKDYFSEKQWSDCFSDIYREDPYDMGYAEEQVADLRLALKYAERFILEVFHKVSNN